MMQRCLYFVPEVGKMYRLMYRLAAQNSAHVVASDISEYINLEKDDLVVLLRAEVLNETNYYRLEVLTPCGRVGVFWYFAETIYSLPPFEEV
jgi:hypothetical protein